MKKPLLYLETSIFGFYYDESPRNITKKESVRKLLGQVRNGSFLGVISGYVLRELRQKADPDLVGLIYDFKIQVAELDGTEVEQLSKKYIQSGVVEESQIGDARHVTAVTILNVDVLVSLNLRHIANTWRVRRFNAVNLKLGYKETAVSIPEEVVNYV